jgi:Ala-tRNA(Pro) deacylase
VDYELHEHPPTETARETAAAEGIDPRRFAKTLAVQTADGVRALIALDATDSLDLRKAARLLHTERVRLLTEAELEELASDCEVGAIPPVGALYGVPVFADFGVREDPEISFHAGSHRYTVHVEREAWERAVGVVYGDVELNDPTVPAWAR